MKELLLFDCFSFWEAKSAPMPTTESFVSPSFVSLYCWFLMLNESRRSGSSS